METKDKTFYIEVEPQYMNNKIRDTIHQKVSEKFVNTCNQRDGYILKIDPKFTIINSGFNDCSSNMFFKINTQIEVLFPKYKSQVECQINMIFRHGIFAGQNELKVLIPDDTISDYKYSEKDSCYVHKKDRNLEIKNGMNILVEITETRYENRKFSCIGKLLKMI